MPGTSNFIGEFLVLAGIFNKNMLVAVLAAIGMVLGAVYAIWLYNRVMFGSFKTQYITSFSDVNRREFFIYLPLLILVLIMGIFSKFFLEMMHISVIEILLYGK